eukprot:GILI01017510.1.p1 GENE.GILI01017510.1~~GILI01017510.1.p1  ORF type:complete len:243 (+),score=48.69 GILI01017510.1:56-784(+)
MALDKLWRDFFSNSSAYSLFCLSYYSQNHQTTFSGGLNAIWIFARDEAHAAQALFHPPTFLKFRVAEVLVEVAQMPHGSEDLLAWMEANTFSLSDLRHLATVTSEADLMENVVFQALSQTNSSVLLRFFRGVYDEDGDAVLTFSTVTLDNFHLRGCTYPLSLLQNPPASLVGGVQLKARSGFEIELFLFPELPDSHQYIFLFPEDGEFVSGAEPSFSCDKQYVRMRIRHFQFSPLDFSVGPI